MPYTINTYSGAQITVVADGTIDSTLDIKLIGKNYAGFGEIQNENFLFLLENFAGNIKPARAIAGQCWYDSGTKKLKFYDGTKFKTTGGAEVSATQPTGLVEGDFWWDSIKKQLFSYNGSSFTLVGPQSTGTNETQMVSRTVIDNSLSELSHSIIEAKSNGITIFVISSDPEFTLSALNPITGFTKISRGVTLVNTLNGVTISGENGRYWGTASNSDRLGGVLAANFITAANSEFSGVVSFGDAGLTVGVPTRRLKIFNNVDWPPFPFAPTIRALDNNPMIFQTSVLSQIKTPLQLVGLDTLPGDTLVSDIGSIALKFKAIYASRFEGIALQSDSITVAGTGRSASTAVINNTVAVRDSNGDLSANLFRGIATSAQYADLAEKYLTDVAYEVGTVVMIGGEQEVTAAQVGFRALGAVSEKPAYMMNSELEGGTYIALKGRVPVKVRGLIIKGQKLVAGADGTAQAAMGNNVDVFAIALESNTESGVKLIEAVIL